MLNRYGHSKRGARHRMSSKEVESIEVAVQNNFENSGALTVESYQNHIYFYSDVDSDRSLALIKELKELDRWMRSEHISRGLDDLDMPLTPIILHIYSYGGDLMAAFALVDTIKKLKTPVYSIVEGCAASAATLIAMACHQRYITSNSVMLIHQLQGLMWGTHEEFRDEMKLQEALMDRLVSFYTDESSLSEKEIRERLKRDYWMTAEEAIEGGFVDKVWGENV